MSGDSCTMWPPEKRERGPHRTCNIVHATHAYSCVSHEDARGPQEKLLFLFQDSRKATAFIGLSARQEEHSGRWWSG